MPAAFSAGTHSHERKLLISTRPPPAEGNTTERWPCWCALSFGLLDHRASWRCAANFSASTWSPERRGIGSSLTAPA
jgi:hypothetical protein